MNGLKLAAAVKPRWPAISTAVGSCPGIIIIAEYPFISSGQSDYATQTYEIQRPNVCERFGSATRLKAGSHPIGGRESVITTGDETVEIFFGASGNRSPLWV